MNSRLVFTLSWWLCLVGWGLPRVGLAAGDAPREAPLRLALSGPLAGPEESPDTLRADPPERFHPPRGLRVLAEVGVGLAAAPVGGLVLGLAGYGFCSATRWGSDSSVGCLGPLLLGSALGIVEGYGLGVWWGGELMGGDGFLALTLLGATAGVFSGYAVLQSGYPELGGYSLLVLPVLLSHLGYELFQRAPASIHPLVSFSSQGAQLGLGGRF